MRLRTLRKIGLSLLLAPSALHCGASSRDDQREPIGSAGTAGTVAGSGGAGGSAGDGTMAGSNSSGSSGSSGNGGNGGSTPYNPCPIPEVITACIGEEELSMHLASEAAAGAGGNGGALAFGPLLTVDDCPVLETGNPFRPLLCAVELTGPAASLTGQQCCWTCVKICG